jgi:hypothetical protein
MHIKNPMTYHLTPVKRAILKKTVMMLVRMKINGKKPLYTVGGNVN